MAISNSVARIAKILKQPHVSQFNILKGATKLNGKKAVVAYAGATLFAPATLGLTALANRDSDNSGAVRAFNAGLIGSAIGGPLGGVLLGYGVLNAEADKLEQQRLEREQEEMLERIHYYEDEADYHLEEEA